MKTALSALKTRPIRASAKAGAQTSVAVPLSENGSTSLENSQGASRAVSELSSHLLDEALDLDSFEDTSSWLKATLEKLDGNVSAYENSSLAFCHPEELWTCDESEAEKVAVAWDCAAKVYGREAVKIAQLYDYSPEKPIESSTSGTTKQTAFTIVSQAAENAESASRPILVIAVRGSRSVIDHIVNLNGDQKDAHEILSKPFGKTSTIHAHAGFLSCAKSMKHRIFSRIQAFLDGHNNGLVLFTGHSAGGAVASLLHLFARAEFIHLSTSCITFGSPPVANLLETDGEAVPSYWEQANELTLNIINEFDLVTRADKDYIRSLLALYKNSMAGVVCSSTTCGVWMCPAPSLRHIGRIVAFQKRLERESQAEISLKLQARTITPEELSGVVFCRICVHKRECYEERIEKLRHGYFNGRKGWAEDV